MDPITPAAATSFQTGPQAKASDNSSAASALAATQSAPTDEEVTAAQSEEPEFSTRAERLAALNEEFNIMGSDFRVSTAFVQRLHELDFINDGEAEQLMGRMPQVDAGSTDSGTAIQSLQASLVALAEEEGSDSSLFDLLNRSAEALGNLSQQNRSDLEGLTQQLDQVLGEPSDLSESARSVIGQARDALMIGSRLAPGTGVNAAIESYLSHSG